MFKSFGKWLLGVVALIGGFLTALTLSSRNNKNKELSKEIITKQEKKLKSIQKKQKQVKKKTAITNEDIKKTAKKIKQLEKEKKNVKTKKRKKSASSAAGNLRNIARRRNK